MTDRIPLGTRVEVLANDYSKGAIGTVIEDDKSPIWPYKVRFDEPQGQYSAKWDIYHAHQLRSLTDTPPLQAKILDLQKQIADLDAQRTLLTEQIDTLNKAATIIGDTQ